MNKVKSFHETIPFLEMKKYFHWSPQRSQNKEFLTKNLYFERENELQHVETMKDQKKKIINCFASCFAWYHMLLPKEVQNTPSQG